MELRLRISPAISPFVEDSWKVLLYLPTKELLFQFLLRKKWKISLTFALLSVQQDLQVLLIQETIVRKVKAQLLKMKESTTQNSNE